MFKINDDQLRQPGIPHEVRQAKIAVGEPSGDEQLARPAQHRGGSLQ